MTEPSCPGLHRFPSAAADGWGWPRGGIQPGLTAHGSMRDVGALGRVMLTDDEQRILSFVRRGLRAEGLHVDEARSGEQGSGTG
jgi:hypothetical protein